MDSSDFPATFISRSADDTRSIGEQLTALFNDGDVISLEGELGAGKTELVKGIGKGLGLDADRDVTSPTFTLINIYDGKKRVYHVDLYRLGGGYEELDGCGLFDFLGKEGITVIEWGDRAKKHLPMNTLQIIIEILNENQRKITLIR